MYVMSMALPQARRVFESQYAPWADFITGKAGTHAASKHISLFYTAMRQEI